jgi:hypothetical protein
MNAAVSRQKLASLPPISRADRCPQITDIENRMLANNAANTRAL